MATKSEERADILFFQRNNCTDRKLTYELVVISIIVGIFGNMFVNSLYILLNLPQLGTFIFSGMVLLMVWAYYNRGFKRAIIERNEVEKDIEELAEKLS
jgi:hypothetical protein